MWFLVFNSVGILGDEVIHCSIKSSIIVQDLYRPEISTHVGGGLDGR